MTISFSSALPVTTPSASPIKPAENADAAPDAEIIKKFEQMLWAEMLTHAGLEKAFTQSGGEAASAFSRYIVEAIAEDISEKHPLGLSKEIDIATLKAGEGS